MLTILHPRCIRNICVPAVLRPSTCSLATAASPRHLFPDWTFSNTRQVAKNNALTSSRSLTISTPSLKNNKAPGARNGLKTANIPKTLIVDSKKARWTNEETQRLIQLFADGQSCSRDQLQAKFPDRTLHALQMKVSRLKLTTQGRTWKKDEIDRLLALEASGVEPIDMVKSFEHRTQLSIIQRLGLLRPRRSVRKLTPAVLEKKESVNTDGIQSKPQFWTAEEDEILRKMVQRAKEADPEHWRVELGRLMSNSDKRQGLHPSRNVNTAVRRLDTLRHRGLPVFTHWTTEEDELLTAAVAAQIGPNFYPRIDLTADTSSSKDNDEGGQKTPGKKAGRSKKRYLAPHSRELEGIDWSSVSERMGSRDQYRCQRRFMNMMTNRHVGSWTKEELESMKSLLLKYGEDWDRISQALGTRTPWQIYMKFRNEYFK